MTKYQEALREVMTGDCFAGCMIEGQEVTPASIAEDMAVFADAIRRQLENLSSIGHYPELLAEAMDELATNAGILRTLAEARVKLVLAAEADGLCIVAAPEGATLH
ncbi:hypothetical protein AWB79_07530 [Caballeronia hypogeia]|uniref:Uncharacterized protein n=1 Tax=Caballeronia hypogeia TaxID=1777140 RepID=A0A158DTM5_9BURK|nr:hypothetical protein [Caballeronia hypogeia]SAK97873.1 hypothetical protein AWB79_07530 [Caballeronia hypogeia]